MSKTRRELIDEVLDRLGILVPGQAASSANVNKVDGIIDPTIAKLNGLEIFYISDAGSVGPSDGDIDDAVFLPLADYIANEAAPKFNLPADTKLKTLAIEAEATMRTLARPPSSRKFLRIDSGIPTARRWNPFIT
ncbi:MAG: hypothetical protein IJ935_07485 [Afipia sp.]|nr:hypothetical protein [Afipia sp.]